MNAIRNTRIFSGVLLPSLFIPSLLILSSCEKQEANDLITPTEQELIFRGQPDMIPPANINDYLGTWEWIDGTVTAIAIVTIQKTANIIEIHEWGFCTPTYCDWGGRAEAMPGPRRIPPPDVRRPGTATGSARHRRPINAPCIRRRQSDPTDSARAGLRRQLQTAWALASSSIQCESTHIVKIR